MFDKPPCLLAHEMKSGTPDFPGNKKDVLSSLRHMSSPMRDIFGKIMPKEEKSQMLCPQATLNTLLVILKCGLLDWKVLLVIFRLNSRSLSKLVTVTVGASRSVSALWWIVWSVDWTPRLFPDSGREPPWAHNAL